MAKIRKGVLLHSIGRRDIQYLVQRNEGWLSIPFKTDELAPICQYLLDIGEDSMEDGARRFRYLKKDVPGYSEEYHEKISLLSLKNTSSVQLCMPILEGIFQVIQDAGVKALERIYLFNTNRQEHLHTGNELDRYAQMEPYAFSEIIQTALERTTILDFYFHDQHPRGICSLETVLQGQAVDRESVFPFMETWIEQHADILRKADVIFVSSNPGIPSISEALLTILSFKEPAKKILLIDKPEGAKGKTVAVPNLIQYYRDRQAILRMLDSENFNRALDLLHRPIFSGMTEIHRRCQIAAQKLQGVRNQDPAAENIPWATAPVEDDLAFLLVKTIHLLKNEQYDLGGIFVITCLEQCARRGIESRWPDSVVVENGEEFLVLDRLPRSARRKINIRSSTENRIRPNFTIYKKLLSDIDSERELRSLIDKCDQLRNCRNNLLHRAEAIPRRVLEQLAELNLGSLNRIEDSVFANLVRHYLHKPQAFQYWPRAAAVDIRDLMLKQTFHQKVD